MTNLNRALTSRELLQLLSLLAAHQETCYKKLLRKNRKGCRKLTKDGRLIPLFPDNVTTNLKCKQLLISIT